MIRNLYNLRKEEVGFYDDEAKTFYSRRYISKGQLFLKKNYFNGEYKERAIAIDRNILSSLMVLGCKRIIFTIIGLESRAFSVWTTPEEVLKKGVRINFDKKDGNGSNITNYGEQYVISSVADVIRMDENQMVLELEKKEFR